MSFRDSVNGRVADIRAVDDGDPAAALDLESVVGSDEGCGVLVEADSHGKGVVDRRSCTAGARRSRWREMLVYDDTVGEAQTGGEAYAPATAGRALLAGCDHVLGEHAGAGPGAADGDATCVAAVRDRGRDGRAAEQTW